MLRHRAAKSSTVDARLLISTGSPAEVLYRSELMRLAAGDGLAVHHTFTRDPPAAWRGFARRLDADMLKAIGPAPARRTRIFACGPTAFVGRAADLLVQLGHERKGSRSSTSGSSSACPSSGWPRPKGSPRPPSTSRAMTRTTSTPPRCTLTAGGLPSDRRALSGSRTGLLWRTHVGRIVGSVIAASRATRCSPQFLKEKDNGRH
jgi:ferredoxin-NADP reductase